MLISIIALASAIPAPFPAPFPAPVPAALPKNTKLAEPENVEKPKDGEEEDDLKGSESVYHGYYGGYPWGGYPSVYYSSVYHSSPYYSYSYSPYSYWW